MSEEIDRLVLTAMPHFMAVHYQKMLEAETWSERINEALCVFELGLRALALGLVSQYLIRDAELFSNLDLNDLLAKRLYTATLGIWQEILFTALRAYENRREIFFMPELYDFFWDISTTPHRPRLGIQDPFTRLVQIRSDLAQKSVPADDAAWGQLGKETLDLLRTVLAQFDFLEHYELIRVTGQDKEGWHYECYSGLQIRAGETPLRVSESTKLKEGWFYLSKDKQRFLELHPLLIFWEELPQQLALVERARDNVALYESFVVETVRYLTAALWDHISISETVGDFARRVSYALEKVKMERLETAKLTWWQLQRIANKISEQRMGGAQEKYRADLYLQRDATKLAFDKFLASDKACFVLTGKSGVGKSNFLLSLTEEYHTEHPEICLLMYNGATLDPTQSLTAIVIADFENRLRLTGRKEDKGVDNIWLEIERVEGIKDRKVVLVIDAINENMDGRALLRQINELVESSPWPWLKVIVISRPETWRNIKQGVPLAEGRYYREVGKPELGFEMEGFTYSELPRVYEKYCQVYDLQMPYTELPLELKEVLRDPLMLRLVGEIYQGQAIPRTVKVRDIYKDYIDALIGTQRIQERDVQFLEGELIPLMIGEKPYRNTIPGSVVFGARTSDGRRIYELIHGEEVLTSGRAVNASYRNLADADILEQRGTPSDYVICFRYERFYEYYAGKYIHESNRGREDLVGRYRELVQWVPRCPFLWGAIERALVLELEEGKRELFFRLAETGDLNMAGLVVAALTDYGERSREDVKWVLSKLLERKGSAEGVSNAKRVAIEVAANLGMAGILEAATRDKSNAIREFAALHMYYLWTRDKPLGYEIIEEISKRAVSPWGLPNSTAIGTMMHISALIGANHLHKDREAVEPLLGVWRKTLSSIPLLKVVQKVRSLMLGFGDRILTALVHSYTGAEGRQDFSAFFSLPLEERRRICSLANYLDPAYGDLGEVESELVVLMQVGGGVNFGIVHGVLLSHFCHDPHGALPLIKRMVCDVDTKWSRGTATGSIALALHSMKMKLSPGEFEEFAKIAEEYYLEEWRRPAAEVFGRSDVPRNPLMLEALRGLSQSRFVDRALELSGEQRRRDDLRTMIRTLGLVGLRGYPGYALQTLQQWFDLDDAEVREDLALALAKIGTLYPEELRQYLALEATPRQLVQRVGELTGSQVLGEVLGAGNWELTTGVVLDPVLRPYFVRFIQDVAECPNQRAAERLLIDTIFSLIRG